MAIIKCKMCGGDLKLTVGVSTAECEYCGSLQTIPNLDDEKKLIQFERAERLRKQCEFDKAAGIYESIVADFHQEAEAYWGLVLCKFGIEYVSDPTTGKKIPTCHRSSFDSILDDSDFEQAVENADLVAQRVYREEAKQFERIRKGILEVSATEKPYDIFICYKETDEKGDRTLDSVLAQDLYEALSDKGYRVFFSRITLRGKLGEAYEPYIFAALHSAKVMLAVGTCYEHFNAVWVKNEWSRYLKICQEDKTKHLIPCFKNLDPEDMPREFNHLQGADLGKMGAVQDILFNMEKYISLKKETAVILETVPAGNNIVPLLERAFLFLEDGDWERADAFCEQVLNLDPKNARAYVGKLMAELQIPKQEALQDQEEPFHENNNYQKAVRFADESLKATLVGYIEHIGIRNETARMEAIYTRATELMETEDSEEACKEAAELFASIRGYKDADALTVACAEKAELLRKEHTYEAGIRQMQQQAYLKESTGSLERAMEYFASIPGYKDADAKFALCQNQLEAFKAKAEADRIAAEQKAEADRIAAEQQKKRKRKILWISLGVGTVVLAILILLFAVVIPSGKYKDAVALMESGKYAQAAILFEELGNYKDSKDRMNECNAIQLEKKGELAHAALLYGKIKNDPDAQEKCLELWDQAAERHSLATGEYHTVGLKTDGTVVATGDNSSGQCNVENWKDIIAVSAGDAHTVGLKKDGTVVAVGDNSDDQCDVSEWKDIVAVSAGGNRTIGLKKDGTVVGVGYNILGQYKVSDWKDMIAVSAGGNHVAGLKADGTVVVTGVNLYGQRNAETWTDITAVSAGSFHVVGLQKDGTVVSTGNALTGQLDIDDWKSVVAISAGDGAAGLLADGTVEIEGEKNVGWTNIVAVSTGGNHTVGLKKDGTVVANGSNWYNQCNVDGWTNIKTGK